MIIERCGALPRTESGCVRGERIVTRRHGYLPSWRCQVGKVLPPCMAASIVHFVIDVTSWLTALVVVPAVLAPFSDEARWSPESVFLIVALTVQIVASQSRVTRIVEPDFFGISRWMLACLAAAAVVGVLFQEQPVSWDLLAAGSLIAFVLRAAAEDVIFSLRRALYHRASTLMPRPSEVVPARAPAAIPVRPAWARSGVLLALRSVVATGRSGLRLVGALRH